MTKGVLSVALLLLLPSMAFARTFHLKGAEANAFIAQHFPNAEIPGPVAGRFMETDGRGRHWGSARCYVPAMGSRANGEVSTCAVTY